MTLILKESMFLFKTKQNKNNHKILLISRIVVEIKIKYLHTKLLAYNFIECGRINIYFII